MGLLNDNYSTKYAEVSGVVSNSHLEISTLSDNDRDLLDIQLSKILKSSHFKSAQQMQRFLNYIIDIALQGKGHTLKQYNIAVDALGYPEEFDSDSNPLVRILGGRVRDRLKKYFKGEGKHDSLVISIPKGTYVPVIEKRAVSNPSVEKIENTESRGPRLGIFCFKDDVLGQDSNSLLVQISSTIVNELSRFIFSRLYVQIPYLGESRADVIGKEGRNNFNLDFSLLLFIQALPKGKYELVYRLWDNKKEEVISSALFDVSHGQAEKEQSYILKKISIVVADLFQGKLHTCWSRALLKDESTIKEKYQVLAYYRYYLDNFGKEAFEKAVPYCQEALERNPQDIIANMIFADYCRREYVYDYGVIKNPLLEGRQCAELATRLRPDSHEAHFVMAQILFCLNEWNQSIGEFNLARDISKNHAVIEYGTGFHFCMMGHWEEGLSLVKKTMEVSDEYPVWFNITPFLYYYIKGFYEDALIYAVKITVPRVMHGPLARCICYSKLGEREKAKSELEQLLVWCPDFMDNGQQVLERFLGTKELADQLWDALLKADEN